MLAFARSVRFAFPTASLVLLVVLGSAAEPGNRIGGLGSDAASPRRVVANKPVAENMTQAQRRDRQIADWLVQCNQNEIALARLATSKTDNKQVRQFAEMLEKDHSQYLSKLERFAGPIRNTTPAAGNEVPRGKVDVTSPFVEVAVGGNGQGTPESAEAQGGLNFLAVQRQIGQRFLDLTEKAWESKNGHERDMAFVGRQLVMHEHLIATEEVLRQYASPDLQPLIDNNLKEAHSHLNNAKTLIEELAHHEHSSK